MKRGRKAHCLYCKSKRTIGRGYRPTVTLGRRSLRVCKDCGRKFTVGRLNVATSVSPIAPMIVPVMNGVTPTAPAMPPMPDMSESQESPASTGP
jgi:transposase-like protein